MSAEWKAVGAPKKGLRLKKFENVVFSRASQTFCSRPPLIFRKFSQPFTLRITNTVSWVFVRGGIEDTRLEAKTNKGHKKMQGQGQPYRGQTLSRPWPGILEAKVKDQRHKRKCSPKKEIFFRRSPKKKVFKNFCHAILLKETQTRSSQIFREVSGVFQHNFTVQKIVLFSSRGLGNFRGQGFKAKDLTFEAKDFKMCPRGHPRGQECPWGLHLWYLR